MLDKKWLLLGSFFAIVLLLLQAIPGIGSYINAVKAGYMPFITVNDVDKQEAVPAMAAARSDESGKVSRSHLLDMIQAEAAKRKIAPINAKMDPVWKAIPGYNGLEVDIEETLKLAEHHLTPGKIHYVMKETSPAIQLDDLGPSPIYKGNPKKPMVSLMINVAWGNEYLPHILETLRKEHVHATFFFDGSWLKKNIETAKKIQSEGHELSNHAYSHKDMRSISRSKAVEEISKTEDLLKQQLGVTNTLFAPPSGYFKEETVQVASEFRLKTVLWTFDTLDWKNPGADRIIQRLSKSVEPGSLILMHPTSSSSQAIEGMIRIIKNKGLTLGTVSELLSPNRVPESGSIMQ
ncbi:polysaccharide deacetylase family protein [Paenibacillus sedimenti]|uniref:Polysaccharide deacetylase family protein n=1 Tax=Paenibacillus sedimenti TaxID=2770274 RepID=A0A926QI74_9BACL|nr:polysaccharide deacetylase family protein [Paenibacillus sedimenti]MBD0380306.1 polysaccharide deacetylase family protein [Paenibacillus sedimenti]